MMMSQQIQVGKRMVIKIDMPNPNSWLKDSGYTIEQEQHIFNATLQDVLDNTRWYLDNLHYIREYRVSWECYTKKRKDGKKSITFPINDKNIYK